MYLSQIGSCSDADLKAYFTQYGTVEYVGVPNCNGKRGNRGFVIFCSVEEASKAFEAGVDDQGNPGRRRHQIGSQSIQVTQSMKKDKGKEGQMSVQAAGLSASCPPTAMDDDRLQSSTTAADDISSPRPGTSTVDDSSTTTAGDGPSSEGPTSSRYGPTSQGPIPTSDAPSSQGPTPARIGFSFQGPTSADPNVRIIIKVIH